MHTHRVFHLYAQEMSSDVIDDTIYYLREALRKGVISLDVCGWFQLTSHPAPTVCLHDLYEQFSEESFDCQVHSDPLQTA